MHNLPKTLRTARRKVYGRALWNPEGQKYDEAYCAFAVISRSGYEYQCFRKNGHGIGKLYCRQHAKIIVERKVK